MLAFTGALINGVLTTRYALAVNVYQAPSARPDRQRRLVRRVGAVSSGYVGRLGAAHHGSR